MTPLATVDLGFYVDGPLLMTAQDLHRAEAAYKTAAARMKAKRDARDDTIRAAIALGWTHAQVAEATGLTRGRVNQIVRGRR